MNAIPYALLTLGAICGFVVAWALNEFWTYTIGYLFARIAKVSIPTGVFGRIKPFGFLGTINNTVHRRLSEVAGAAERAMIALFLQTIRAFQGLAHEIAALAETVERQFLSIVAGVLPSAIRNALKSVWALLRQLPKLTKRIAHLVGYVTRVISHAVKAAIGAVWKTLAGLGKRLGHGIGYVVRALNSLAKRVNSLDKYLRGGGGKKLANYLLHAIGFGWILHSNIVKLGKAIVSWSHHLLTAVLRYFGRIDEPLSLEALTKDAQGVLREVDRVMKWYINEYRVTREAPGAPDIGTPA